MCSLWPDSMSPIERDYHRRGTSREFDTGIASGAAFLCDDPQRLDDLADQRAQSIPRAGSGKLKLLTIPSKDRVAESPQDRTVKVKLDVVAHEGNGAQLRPARSRGSSVATIRAMLSDWAAFGLRAHTRRDMRSDAAPAHRHGLMSLARGSLCLLRDVTLGPGGEFGSHSRRGGTVGR